MAASHTVSAVRDCYSSVLHSASKLHNSLPRTEFVCWITHLSMFRLVLVTLFCHLARGAAGQFQEVHPSFCPSSQLVGATCNSSATVRTLTPTTFESQVNYLRCQSGCLMDVSPRTQNIASYNIVSLTLASWVVYTGAGCCVQLFVVANDKQVTGIMGNNSQCSIAWLVVWSILAI